MKTILVLGLLLSACVSVPTVEPFSVSQPDPINRVENSPFLTPFPTPTNIEATPTPVEDEPQRMNWLLLGGDYRAHREGTGWGNKTDVMVLISILESDPVEITAVQFPRNLYAPSSLGDEWMFAIWDKGGWPGLHTYFDEVFGIDLQGIFYVNMDNFVSLVDGLGGLAPWGSDAIASGGGEAVLEYLRDNENNWGYATYDFEQRVHGVVISLANAVWVGFLDDPISTMRLLLTEYGGLIESDLNNVQQYFWIAETASRVLTTNRDFRWTQLEQPFVVRGDTPIIQDEQPMRGLVAAVPLDEWMSEVLDGR